MILSHDDSTINNGYYYYYYYIMVTEDKCVGASAQHHCLSARRGSHWLISIQYLLNLHALVLHTVCHHSLLWGMAECRPSQCSSAKSYSG